MTWRRSLPRNDQLAFAADPNLKKPKCKPGQIGRAFFMEVTVASSSSRVREAEQRD